MVFPSLASRRKVIAARKDSAVSEALYTVVVVYRRWKMAEALLMSRLLSCSSAARILKKSSSQLVR